MDDPPATDDTDAHLQGNREMWDEWADLHVGSDFYNVEAFLAGRCALADIDVSEVGPVEGKTLLHLQCHFGLDTLSWARRGALVTGADFSPNAIAHARQLARKAALPAEFVCCNLYDLPQHLDEQFDVVFTSAGVLPWLPDITRWARTAAHFVRPRGTFYIREFHPFTDVFDWAETPTVRYPYFHTAEPVCEEIADSYSGQPTAKPHRAAEWPHPLGDIVTALLQAGLQLQYLHEMPYCTYQAYPFLARGDDDLWRYNAPGLDLPLMFSIKATKPG